MHKARAKNNGIIVAWPGPHFAVGVDYDVPGGPGWVVRVVDQSNRLMYVEPVA